MTTPKFFVVCTGDCESGFEDWRDTNWALEDSNGDELASWGWVNVPPSDTSTREVSEEEAQEIINRHK